MTIGDHIKRLRQEKNLTQEAVAVSLEVTRQAVAKWENNQTAPSTANLIKLAELFQVQLQELTNVDEDNTNMQAYFLRKVKEEEKRSNTLERLKSFLLSECWIALLYIALGLISWIAFHFIGIPNYIWDWIDAYNVLCISGCIAILSLLCSLKRLSWLLFIGTAFGIVAGNIAGYISKNTNLLGFNNGWMVFLLCVNIAIVLGIGIEFLHRKSKQVQGILSAKKTKILTTVLAVLIIALFLTSGYFSWQRLTYNGAAEEGYKAGFEIGSEDATSGKPMNATLSEDDIPSSYSFGSPSYKGFSVYWPSGYAAGYSSRIKEAN